MLENNDYQYEPLLKYEVFAHEEFQTSWVMEYAYSLVWKSLYLFKSDKRLLMLAVHSTAEWFAW